MQKFIFTMELIEAKMLSTKIKHFAFKIIDNPNFSFTPGQFISLHFKADGMPLKRSYSIASIPGTTDLVEFAATHVDGGPGTKFLFNLQPGETVQTSGPFGKLILREETPKRYIFIGTSTGITPYRSMLTQFSKNLHDPNHNVVVLQGVQSKDDLLYVDDFIELTEKFNNYKFRAHYSRGNTENKKQYEFNGYVQNSFEDLDLNPENDIVYLCGNPYMIEDIVLMLKELDFSPDRIQREKYYSK